MGRSDPESRANLVVVVVVAVVAAAGPKSYSDCPGVHHSVAMTADRRWACLGNTAAEQARVHDGLLNPGDRDPLVPHVSAASDA